MNFLDVMLLFLLFPTFFSIVSPECDTGIAAYDYECSSKKMDNERTPTSKFSWYYTWISNTLA